MTEKSHVIVVGAGVTGLTSAVFLADAGYDVTIIAAHVPGDESIEYTSPWAGADWGTHASADETMLCDWDVQSYEYWLATLEREARDPKLPKSGIKMFECFTYFYGPATGDLWWAPHVRDFRQLSPLQDPLRALNERRPAGASEITNAVAYRTMAINVPHYLRYLQEKASSLGVTVIKTRLPTDAGLANVIEAAERVAGRNAHCFVNATGLGAMKVCGDTSMFPIRGQTVLVKGEAAALRSRVGDGYPAYCITRPGSGTTILGGTRQAGNWSEEVDPETTRTILERCAEMVPELQTGADGTFEVISVQCGLRPGRKGGPRMEKEDVGGRKVVHAYGHAGAGYQNSIGSARSTVKLVRESLGMPAKL